MLICLMCSRTEMLKALSEMPKAFVSSLLAPAIVLYNPRMSEDMRKSEPLTGLSDQKLQCIIDQCSLQEMPYDEII